jgi:hypothetical protein
VNTVNKLMWTNDKGWSCSLRVEHGANNPSPQKNSLMMKHLTELRTWMDSLDKRPKRRNMDMRFRTWNVRSLYRTGSLVTVSKELSKCRLDLVGVQEAALNLQENFCGNGPVTLTTWPPYPQKLAVTSPTSGGRLVGIVRSRTQIKEFFLWIC